MTLTRTRLFVVFSIVNVLAPWMARAESPARQVLKKYLDLDAHAVAVSEATWPQIGAYTTWTQFPSWDGVEVISDYKIDKLLEGHTRAQATVIYQPLGVLSDKFVANTKTETVVFHLNNVNGQWKVDEPEMMPHVAFSVMKARLEENAPNASVKKTNEALIAQIEQARQQNGGH